MIHTSGRPGGIVYVLVQPFIELSLFRRTPQDLPDSRTLLAVALGAHAIVGWSLFALKLGVFEALLAALTGSVLLAGLTASLLAATGHGARLTRTLAALAGVDVIIGLLAVALHLALAASQAAPESVGPADLLRLALLVWNLAVAGNILRHALSAPLAMGVVIALVFYVLSVQAMVWFFPELAAPDPYGDAPA